MGTYLMMLYVSLEQEKALKKFCHDSGWPFHKPDLNALTEQIGPPVVPKQIENSSTDKRSKSKPSLSKKRLQSGTTDEIGQLTCAGVDTEDNNDHVDDYEPSWRKTEVGTKRKSRHQRFETHSPSLRSSSVRKSARLSKRRKVTGTFLSAVMLKRKWNENESQESDQGKKTEISSAFMKDEPVSHHTKDKKKVTVKEELSSHNGDSESLEQNDYIENFEDSQTWESLPTEESKMNVKDTDDFVCSLCQFHAADKHSLEDHYKTEHSIQLKICKLGSERTCSVCYDVFSSQKSFKKHIERHETESGQKIVQPFGCNLCGEKFTKLSEHKKHLKADHGESHIQKHMYICDICGKIFKRSDYLKEHKDVIHLGITKEKKLGKGHICEICGCNFKRQCHLNEHTAVKHNNSAIREHACTHCSKTFHRPYILEYHINKEHLQSKPYECDKCKRKFFSKVTLRNHQRYCEMSEDSMITCEYCGKKIKTTHNYKLHIQAVHSDPALICACGKVVRWQSSVTKHKRRCPLHAANLGEKFSEKSGKAKKLEEPASNMNDNVSENGNEIDKGNLDAVEDDSKIRETNDQSVCDLQEIASPVGSSAEIQMIFTDTNEVNEINPDCGRGALDVSHADDNIFADLVNGVDEQVVEISSTTSLGNQAFEDKGTGNVFYVIMKK